MVERSTVCFSRQVFVTQHLEAFFTMYIHTTIEPTKRETVESQLGRGNMRENQARFLERLKNIPSMQGAWSSGKGAGFICWRFCCADNC